MILYLVITVACAWWVLSLAGWIMGGLALMASVVVAIGIGLLQPMAQWLDRVVLAWWHRKRGGA